MRRPCSSAASLLIILCLILLSTTPGDAANRGVYTELLKGPYLTLAAKDTGGLLSPRRQQTKAETKALKACPSCRYP